MRITLKGLGSRSWFSQGGQWFGQVRCHRDRCHNRDTFSTPNHEKDPYFLSFRATKEDKEKHEAEVAAANSEYDSHELPAGWVQVALAGDGGNHDPTSYPRVFCSANCAALWLKKQ